MNDDAERTAGRRGSGGPARAHGTTGEGETAAAGLRVAGLRKVFPSPAGDLVVLDGVDLALAAGETLAIVGPSGCGKSTLLHILGTLDRPTAGMVRLDGVDPFELEEPELARFRNRRVGFVFQDHYLLPQCTVLENVLMPALAARRTPADEDALVARARALIDRVGIGGRRDHLPAEISGGERQRAAIARALLMGPDLLLCDEPTGNLDRSSAASVADLLLEARGLERTMLVVVTHNQELAARFDRCSELDGGRLT